MGRVEVIQKIKETEARVSEKIEDAKKRKNSTIENARRKARAIEDESNRKSRDECNALLDAARKHVEGERKIILDKGKAEADSLRKAANTTKAKEFFVSKFEEYVR